MEPESSDEEEEEGDSDITGWQLGMQSAYAG
jgi:hypothetical protein